MNEIMNKLRILYNNIQNVRITLPYLIIYIRVIYICHTNYYTYGIQFYRTAKTHNRIMLCFVLEQY